MKLIFLPNDFSVCSLAEIPKVLPKGLFFLGRTNDEISLVCETAVCPKNTLAREEGWVAFKVDGTLDFSLVGILEGIAKCLAEEGISLFALSTYKTDYVLVKKEQAKKAENALRQKGYAVDAYATEV